MRALLARRGNGEPVAYLLGSWSFRGLELDVGPAVLIPRPETEELGRPRAGARCRRGAVLDLGTGSGAIAIALAVERPDLRVVAVDQPERARVAAANVPATAWRARVQLRCGSWWEPVPPDDVRRRRQQPALHRSAATAGLAADVRRARAAVGAVLGGRRRAVVLPRDRRRSRRAPAARRLARRRDRRRRAVNPRCELLAEQPFLTEVQLLPDHGRARPLPARAARLNVRRRHSGPCWSPRRRPFAAL
jgi:hypothetical protein